ncbi:porin [Thermithiobacillus plumbiphilus]|uniref:Porin n=1 Tax=Thermithiobacillus plumbiphilus TaxID=1729899 RepID=A0ABU9D9C9_9PROT
MTFAKWHRQTKTSLARGDVMGGMVKGVLSGTVLAILMAGISAPVQAGGILKIDDDHWISVGAGLRTNFTVAEDAAPSGADYSKDFDVDSVRLYVNGKMHRYIKFTFNTEKAGELSDIRLLDAIAQFEFSDTANIWMGRFLPPTDRANLDGPYYLGTYDYPFVSAYPAILAGRDNGAAFWGQVGKGKFKYQVGAFEGRREGSNQGDNLLYSGRLVLNLWDPEPGYYNSSTYFGAANILAFGASMTYQKDGAGTEANPGNFRGLTLDALMDRKLPGDGVVTLEGAYYDYDLDDVPDPSLVQGDGYLAYAAYMFPQAIGIGKFQPHVRYQKLNPDSGTDHERTDLGVNYVISGHDALISGIYSRDKFAGEEAANIFKLGVQLQY